VPAAARALRPLARDRLANAAERRVCFLRGTSERGGRIEAPFQVGRVPSPAVGTPFAFGSLRAPAKQRLAQRTSRSTIRESCFRFRHSSARSTYGRYLSITLSPKPQALGLSGFSQTTSFALLWMSRRHQARGSL
jgi:hypothetical protein